MPIVPTDNETALPTVRFQTESPLIGDTSQSSQATSNLANVAGQIADKQQKDANDAKLIGVDADLTNFKNDQLYNPQYGALQQRGENALGVVDSYGQKFQQKVDDLYSSLSNPEQRDMFKQRSSQIASEFRMDLEKHTYVEGKALEDEKYKVGQDSYLQDAILNYTNPGKVQQNLDLTEGLIRTKAAKDGITDPDIVDTLVTDAASKIHAGVIERASNNGQDQFAMQYFKDNKDELGDKLEPVEKTLEEATSLAKAQTAVKSYVSDGLSMTDALSEARDISDPKTQQKATELTRQYFIEQKQAVEDQQKKLFGNAINTVDQNPSISAISATDWAAMTPENKKFTLNYIEEKQKGIQPPPNSEEYYRLKTMAVTDPAAYGSVNLMQYKGQVRDSELEQLINAQDRDDKGHSSAIQALGNYPTQVNVANDLLQSAGLDPNAKFGTAQERIVSKFRSQLGSQIQTLENSGQKVDQDTIKSLANNMLVKGITNKGLLWNSTKPIIALEPGEDIQLNVSDIPQSERDQIRSYLARSNIPISDDNIVKVFLKATRGQ